MLTELAGTAIRAESGAVYTLEKMFAQGGQGVIYKANCERHRYMIKLYKKEEKEILPALRWLKKQKFPKEFILPIDVFSVPHCGYSMNIVDDHVPLTELLYPPVDNFFKWYNGETGGLRRRLYLGYLIARRFAELHNLGCAYCDLSGANILVNKKKEVVTVRMIDADNIYVPGSRINAILGTSRYMAPEIRKNMSSPNTFTDDYSLAVLLFELLRCGHPYVGDLVLDSSPECEELAYRGYFAYVDDADDVSNCSTQILPADGIFTEELKKLFKKTFIDGKENNLMRPRALEYALACLDASNKLVKCPHCHAWCYAPSKNNKQCPWCDGILNKPWSLLFQDICTQYDSKGKVLDRSCKNINSYILRKEFNFIPDSYLQQVYVGPNKNKLQKQEIPNSLLCRRRDIFPEILFDIGCSQDNRYYIRSPKEEICLCKYNGKNINLFGDSYQELEKGDFIRFGPKYSSEFVCDRIRMVFERVATVIKGD